MSISKNSTEHVTEHVDGGANGMTARPRKRGCMGFVRKWWWLLLIIGVVVGLVVLLPILFVAIPKIIQGKVNDSQLSIQGIRVTKPQSNSVYTEINSTILSDSSLSATIDGFNASLYLEDKLPHTPFAYVQMPSISSGAVTAVNLSQLLPILDAQAYTDYNTVYLLNKTFRMTVSGETYVHVGGLPATKVTFQKTVTLDGLNAFEGLNVTSSNVSAVSDSRGDNFHGYVNVPNPSLLTVEIGNATFKNLFNNSQVGWSYIDNMVLVPGNNNLSIRANISQTPIISAVLSQPYCQTGILPLQFAGDSVISNGQELAYYEAGFRQNTKTVSLDIAAALAPIVGGRLSCPAAVNSTSSASTATPAATGTASASVTPSATKV